MEIKLLHENMQMMLQLINESLKDVLLNQATSNIGLVDPSHTPSAKLADEELGTDVPIIHMSHVKSGKHHRKEGRSSETVTINASQTALPVK